MPVIVYGYNCYLVLWGLCPDGLLDLIYALNVGASLDFVPCSSGLCSLVYVPF